MRVWLFLTVVSAAVLLVAASYFSAKRIQSDLALRAEAAIRDSAQEWASVGIAGRMATLSGQAPDAEQQQIARDAVAAVHGLSGIVDQSTLAPARFFALTIVRAPDRVTIQGEVPDQATLDRLTARVEAALDGVTVEPMVQLVGGRPSEGWTDVAEALVEQVAARLVEGQAVLAVDGVAVTGSVADADALSALQAALTAVTDSDIALDITVREPRVYPLRIVRDENHLIISGEAPSRAIRENLIELAQRQGQFTVNVDNFEVVRGDAVDDWQEMAAALIRHASAMQRADVDLSEERLRVTGTVAEPGMADVIRSALASVFGQGDSLILEIDITSGALELPETLSVLPTLGDTAALLTYADTAPIPDIPDDELIQADACQVSLNALISLHQQIRFIDASADLDPESVGVLEAAALTIRHCRDSLIEVSGHTDSQGDAQSNQSLSEARAAAVVDYLARRGIDRDRLVAAGYGDLIPIADNATEDGRARNRRIDFIVEPSPQ